MSAIDPTPTLHCTHRGHTICQARWSDWRPGMRCLRIYATPDGESHFGEVDIAMTMTPAFPNEAPFELSAYYQHHASVLLTSPSGCAKRAFTSLPKYSVQ